MWNPQKNPKTPELRGGELRLRTCGVPKQFEHRASALFVRLRFQIKTREIKTETAQRPVPVMGFSVLLRPELGPCSDWDRGAHEMSGCWQSTPSGGVSGLLDRRWVPLRDPSTGRMATVGWQSTKKGDG